METYKSEMDVIENLDANKFIRVRLNDMFETVKKKINYNYSTLGKNIGNVPLIACKKLDNGIARYVDKEEYEGDVLTVVKHRDATAGYVFNHNGKIAWNGSIYVIKLKQNKILNLDLNAKLMTIQLCPNHLEVENLKNNFLDEKEIYLYL